MKTRCLLLMRRSTEWACLYENGRQENWRQYKGMFQASKRMNQSELRTEHRASSAYQTGVICPFLGVICKLTNTGVTFDRRH